jgi:hypothetical protein
MFAYSVEPVEAAAVVKSAPLVPESSSDLNLSIVAETRLTGNDHLLKGDET